MEEPGHTSILTLFTCSRFATLSGRTPLQYPPSHSVKLSMLFAHYLAYASSVDELARLSENTRKLVLERFPNST